jgi:hypothetical protein
MAGYATFSRLWYTCRVGALVDAIAQPTIMYRIVLQCCAMTTSVNVSHNARMSLPINIKRIWV